MTLMPKQFSEAMNEPMGVRRRQAAALLGISERHLDELTKSGRIPSVRLGRAVIYPVDLLRAWLEQEAKK